MAIESSLVFAGIAPHPPIMVPEVGGEAIVDVRTSIKAMAELTRRVIASGAETVVLISPHAPLQRSAFVAYDGPQVYGDFSDFRAPTATIDAEVDEELLNAIARFASESALTVARISGADLDHGTMVPLYFLQRHGWRGRVVAFGYSFLSNEDHIRFGNCIRAAVNSIRRPVAFVASGDLSHRLKPGAPAGYDPEAHCFDEEIVDAIRSSSVDRIVSLDHELRRLAGECGYRSMLVAVGAVAEIEKTCEVISYEGPFGVGYMVAQLVSEPPAVAAGPASAGELRTQPLCNEPGTGAELPALARRTIETFAKHAVVITPPDDPSELLNARAACFVSIKTIEGDLRGCMGTLDPARDSLAAEIIANAITASTRDPRFPPVREQELDRLKYSVDVLTSPEPAQLEELDPKTYGVIIEEVGGTRRGLLLPNLEGIDTVEKQIEIASRKAGIKPGTPLRFLRFLAERYAEAGTD